jgi:predicted CxxxxCH...CXXCH cytochrome family protein
MVPAAKPKTESAALLLYPVLLLAGMFAAVAVGTGCVADPGFPAGSPPSNQLPVGGGDQAAGGCDTQDVIETVFAQTCSGANCHSAGKKSGGLDLASPGVEARLVNALSKGCSDRVLVSPGNAAGSYLLDKLQGAGDVCGAPMPLGGTPLDAAKINCVADWIDSLGSGSGETGSGSPGGGSGGDGELPPGGW